MARHFQCTACGKCCYGQLPLTISDAFAHAERFPLGFVWTPLRQGSKDYSMVARLGATIQLADRKELAVLIVPTAYIPPDLPCPALLENSLCAIHAEKPLRCKTMPFYPYRDEQYQAELLVPRKGWACDTAETAPIVFQDKKVVLREDFDAERDELEAQVPFLRRYAEFTLKYSPMMVNSLAKASLSQRPAQVVTSLSSFLTATKYCDAKPLAQKQWPVLKAFAEKTAGHQPHADFHKKYTEWAKEMAYFASRP